MFRIVKVNYPTYAQCNVTADADHPSCHSPRYQGARNSRLENMGFTIDSLQLLNVLERRQNHHLSQKATLELISFQRNTTLMYEKSSVRFSFFEIHHGEVVFTV